MRNETEACEVGASPLEELKLRTRIIPELRTKSSSFSSNQSPVRSLFFTNERPSFKYPNNFTFCENSKEEASHLKGQVKGFGSPGNESVKTGLLTSVSSLPEGKFSENPLYPSVSLRSKESSEKENGPYNHIIYKWTKSFFNSAGQVEVLLESLSDDDGHNQARFCIDLDWLSCHCDFAPWDCLVRTGPWVRPVKLLGSVDENWEISSIFHEICIANVVLDESSANYNNAWLRSLPCHFVDPSDVHHNVEFEWFFRVLPSVEVENISNWSISDGRREDGDIVLPAPVVNWLFIVDFLAKTMDEGRGSPLLSFFILLSAHFSQNRMEPLFKQFIVIVRHDQISDSIKSLFPQFSAFQSEVSHEGRSRTFHKILFNPARSCDNAADHLVLG